MGLAYKLVRPVTRYVLKHYYRRITITGSEHIPERGPVILAANHPTAFIEPCILACFQPRELHFLARGDLFKDGPAKLALSLLNILPVYRLKDGGYGKLRNNYDTFEACYRALGAGGALMILAEGSCVHEKALRPLRKGTARIALGALAADPTLKDIAIVPVGVNFSRPERVRSDVDIACGPPIYASRFYRAYQANPAPALHALTQSLRQSLLPLVVQFPKPKHAAAGETLLSIQRTQGEPSVKDQVSLAAELPLMEKAETLAAHLHKTEVDVGAAAGALQGMKSKQFASNPTLLLLWLGLSAVILLPYLLVWFVSEWIARVTVNTIEFYSPVRFAALTLQTVVLTPLALILLPIHFKIWIVAAILWLPLGIKAFEKYQHWSRLRHWERVTPKDKNIIRTLYQDLSEALDMHKRQ